MASLVSFTFMGRLSTNIPLSWVRASLALPGLLKIIVAIPRLTPLGPYVSIAFLTWPTDLPKYSYSQKVCIESVHWYAVKSCIKDAAEWRVNPRRGDIYGELDQSNGSLLLEHQRASSKCQYYWYTASRILVLIGVSVSRPQPPMAACMVIL